MTRAPACVREEVQDSDTVEAIARLAWDQGTLTAADDLGSANTGSAP